MKLEELKEIEAVIEKLKELKLVNWEIDNISFQYVSAGQINIRLIKVKGANENACLS